MSRLLPFRVSKADLKIALFRYWFRSVFNWLSFLHEQKILVLLPMNLLWWCFWVIWAIFPIQIFAWWMLMIEALIDMFVCKLWSKSPLSIRTPEALSYSNLFGEETPRITINHPHYLCQHWQVIWSLLLPKAWFDAGQTIAHMNWSPAGFKHELVENLMNHFSPHGLLTL